MSADSFFKKSLNSCKYAFCEIFFTNKSIFVLVIYESQGKTLGEDNFSKIEKLSNPTA